MEPFLHLILGRVSAVLRIFCTVVLGFACCIGTVAADAPSGQPVDGIRCDQMEGSVFHIHQHLALYDRGKPVPVPSDVGRPLMGACIYWLHTHTPDGIIHIESPLFRSFTLGEFFDIWGAPLSPSVAGPLRAKGKLIIYVDGQPFVGNPRAIELAQHTDIVIENAPPLVKPGPVDWRGQ
jgi:hypothetical protein